MSGSKRAARVSGVGRPRVVRAELVELRARSRVVGARADPAGGELVERRDQRLGDVAAAVDAEASLRSSRRLHPGANGVVVLDPRRALSVERAESTAHGWTASIAARDVRRARARPRASRGRVCGAGALEVGRVVLVPGQVDDACRPARRPGAGRRRARGGRPRARRAGRGRRRSRAPRRRRRRRGGRSRARRAARRCGAGSPRARMKPTQIGAGLDGGVDVLLARQAAHLDERPREQLARASRPDRGRASASSRRASRSRRRARPRRPGRAVSIADSAITIRSRGACGEQRELARAGRSRRSRGRAR